ncbi:hypothetical protein GECvBN5_gp093c [Salmonella phage GEC_vB_N5]|uniref:Uncharacterized protein n=4 Tax=Markadamsvirinae TaxID=2732013 RepID=A0A7S9SSC6_9CAUD|nr:hypothetical protein GECvBN3_gp096c [Salmonella phage GEC_vB_N3]QPI15109.1 hypothetical protein GECvBN5_gp093c [Salmonella phage GEC_vB_N5]QPI15538.1 hypothetical protein GECvBN7_gp095c [Salmonella phage GEC_vB_N7]
MCLFDHSSITYTLHYPSENVKGSLKIAPGFLVGSQILVLTTYLLPLSAL